jgi:NTE family protein
MEVYGVFAGGGVKGAALVGAYSAAVSAGLKFRGYGGTSAGSIVAMLAAVGYSPDELKSMLVERSFADYFERPRLVRAAAKVKPWVTSKWLRFWNPPALSWPGQTAAIYLMYSQLGIQGVDRLRDFLAETLATKLGIVDSDARSLDFDSLSKKGIDLRVVAADVTKGRPVIWPRDQSTYGSSVVDAVCASAAFPFIFRPLTIDGSHVLDGGMASNLPSFLFRDRYQEDRTPSVAFDLVASPSKLALDGLELAKQCYGACLGVSDVLLRESTVGVHHVQITVPHTVGAFAIDLTLDQRNALYSAGYEATNESLRNYEPLHFSRLAGSAVKANLMVRYGKPDFFEPVLRAVVRDFEDKGLKKVRACVMLPTNRNTRIVVYQWGMDDSPDIDLEIPAEAGCTGVAWTGGPAAVANLEDAAKTPSDWGMTPEQHSKVPLTQKSMLAVPIRNASAQTGTKPIGTLSIDTASHIEFTGWLDSDHKIRQKPVVHLDQWARILERMLP